MTLPIPPEFRVKEGPKDLAQDPIEIFGVNPPVHPHKVKPRDDLPKPFTHSLVDTEVTNVNTKVPEVNTEEAQTHEELLDTIIRTTLRPEHGTDPNILRFIANYNLTKDVKQAARDSGLTATDGKRLIQRPDIYECVQRIAAAGARKFGYDAEEIVAKVKEVIDFDPVELYNPESGAFHEDINLVPPEIRRVIKKMTVQNIYDKDPNGVIIGVHSKILKYEFWDKLKAAEMLGQEKEVFKKKMDVSHDIGSNMKDTLLGRIEAADERRALKAKDVGRG